MAIPLGVLAVAGASAPSAGAYDLIDTVVLSSPASVVDLASIPQTYTHLQVRWTGKLSVTGTFECTVKFNYSAASGQYDRHWLAVFKGDNTVYSGGGINANAITTMFIPGSSDGTNIFAANIMDIYDYKNTSKNTTIRHLGGFWGTSNGEIRLGSGLFRDTSAITDISFTTGSGNFIAGSRFSLYGLKGA